MCSREIRKRLEFIFLLPCGFLSVIEPCENHTLEEFSFENTS